MSLVVWHPGLIKLWNVERKSFSLEGRILSQFAFDQRHIEHDDFLLEAEYNLDDYDKPEKGMMPK